MNLLFLQHPSIILETCESELKNSNFFSNNKCYQQNNKILIGDRLIFRVKA